MNCKEIRPLLSVYHDGETSLEETARVERHLATCHDCRHVLAEYRAIGGGLSAMPVPVPPAGLRRDVWRAIEAGSGQGAMGAARTAQPSNITVLRGGKAAQENHTAVRGRGLGGILPAAGLAAALILALTAVLFLTNRNVVAAAGLREKSPFADYNQALHIEFSRPVIESDALNQNNTYVEVVNGKQTRRLDDSTLTRAYDSKSRVLTITSRQPWVAGAAYNVVVEAEKIRTGVADQTLDTKPIMLSFSALAYTPTATSTSTATASATPTKKPTGTPKPTNTPQPTAVAQNSAVVPPPAGSPTEQPVPSNTPSHTPSPRPSSTATRVPPTSTVTTTYTKTPQPTHTPAPATATSSATATSTTVRKSTTTPTPRLTVTPRVSTTPTPRITATPTPWNACNIQPVNGFGKVWKDNSRLRAELGCPSAHELGIQLAAEQHFQGGYMFWRGDTKSVFVFLGGQAGEWYEFEDTWQDGDPTPAPLGNAPPGLYEPVRGFGKIWREYPGLRQSLGWATDQETNITAAWQAYSGGNMIWAGSNRQIRVMFDDANHSYQTYQDTFMTPTPTTNKRSPD